ncbi:MAG: YkgJ family cysteine cluster protein [Gammaproteobacteria bacterium]|nr:YkgJ family cysteine cluster protein [Gammaproteobacteria bacterium]
MIKQLLRLITARSGVNVPIITGTCNQCGVCCRNLTLYDGKSLIRDHADFEALCRKRPDYQRFRLSRIDEVEQIAYFHCTQLGEDNRCRDYENRPRICRIYPNPQMFRHGARLPAECSYEIAPESSFDAILTQTIKKRRDK